MSTFGDFCSGGGGFAVGAKAAGAEVVFGVEIDADIAQVYKDNLGDHVLCQPLETVDMAKLPSVDHVHISPPCQGFSVARSKKLPDRADTEVGILLLDYVAIHKPRMVSLEQVSPYANAPVFHGVLAGLHSLGYRTQWSIENAANYGVPQTRKRLILRAVREGETLLPLTPTHAKHPEPAGLFGPALLPWNGWYGAIEDILDTLPESQFAPWQLLRLKNAPVGDFLHMTGNTQKANPTGTGILPCSRPANTVCTNSECGAKAFLCGVQGEAGELARDGVPPSPTITTAHDAAKYRAFIVDGQETSPGLNGERLASVRYKSQPVQTVTATAHKGMARAWLEEGRVVAMTPRALAAFQSFPDTFQLPASKSLASKIIGNAVCPDLAVAIARTLPGVNQ